MKKKKDKINFLKAKKKRELSLLWLGATLFSKLLTGLIFSSAERMIPGRSCQAHFHHAKHISSTSTPQFLHWWVLKSDLSKFNQTGNSSRKADNTQRVRELTLRFDFRDVPSAASLCFSAAHRKGASAVCRDVLLYRVPASHLWSTRMWADSFCAS